MKKLCAILMAGMMVAGVGYTPAAAIYSEHNSNYSFFCDDWAAGYMKEAVDSLYLDNKTLRSDATLSITRAEMTVLVVNTMTKLNRFNHAHKWHYSNTFTDVDPNSAYYHYIECAYTNGIVAGIGNGKFNPNAPITRQDAAVMFYRMMETTHPNLNEFSTAKFADDAKIRHYAQGAVYNLKYYGIINGQGHNIFNPYGNCKIEEAVKMCLSVTYLG